MYEWGLDFASFSIVTPYPGTRLFERLEEEGRITSHDWSRYEEGKVNYKPVHMTEQELMNGITYIARDFFSIKQIMKRSFTFSHLLHPTTALEIFGGNMALRFFYRHEKLSI